MGAERRTQPSLNAVDAAAIDPGTGERRDVTLHFRVLRGAPDADELVAVTAVITALLAQTTETAEPLDADRAQWDRTWTAHVPPSSWCYGGGTAAGRRSGG
ncbi:acyl-CoA carboxylase subunit epsilon [Streptomyces sp. DT199]|uniref:acyl-CoA carboxylase subunit epsilon n=1 Tax=Streptomyces TaxID=1883 RepID=UPI00371A5E24